MAEKTYQIGNMDCAHCAQEVETGVGRLSGVNAVRVDFASGKMVLDGDVTFDQLKSRVEALGKTINDPDVAVEAGASQAIRSRGGILGFWDYLIARWETRLAVFAGVVILLAFMGSLFGLSETVVSIVYTLAMVVALYPMAKNGLNTLLINREFNINLLMTIAAIGAIALGEYLEGATVIFLFAVGEALEGYTADRARDSLRGLMDLAPDEAIRIHDGHEETVSVSALNIGDSILVKPGERVPMDGTVTAGASGVNQAPITGESMPVHKAEGDQVFAGTINGEGALTVEVTRLAKDNTLSRIIQLVEEAQANRAPTQRLIDRFAKYYTPGVVVMATLVAFLPPLLFNAPFYDTPDTVGWLYRALTILVIACPCALVISTPVTVISAIAKAARRGILIKGGAHLESLGAIKAIAFDKTGTLTEGRPVVTQTHTLDCSVVGEPCTECDDMLALAAAVERRSSHPLAQAVVEAASSRHIDHTYAAADDVAVLAGRGVRGLVNGKSIIVGSHSLFDEMYPHPLEFCAEIDEAEANGQTTMLLHDGERVRGYIAVADAIRSDSQSVIKDLNAMGLQTIMLTGDNARVADSVGREIGVSDVRAGLLPQGKVDAVRGLLAHYEHVAMVGDGVNDTPALAAATVGVAMGGAGTAQALETADVALMADDLKQLPYAIKLARFARSLIKQNVALSFGMKGLFLLLALAGGATMWMAVFADVGMSLIVTLNGMRPLRMD